VLRVLILLGLILFLMVAGWLYGLAGRR